VRGHKGPCEKGIQSQGFLKHDIFGVPAEKLNYLGVLKEVHVSEQKY
jgi:hypothetical protein